MDFHFVLCRIWLIGIVSVPIARPEVNANRELPGSRPSSGDVFASLTHLHLLADGERDLVKALEHYLEQEELRLRDIERLVQEVENVHEHSDSKDALTFVGNPLNAFHLIKRFATTWRGIWEIASNFSHYEALRSQTAALAHLIPQENDYQGAVEAILRLQRIYQLPTADLVLGVIRGGDGAGARGRPLSQRAAVDIARAASVGQSNPTLALEWLGAVRESTIPPLTPAMDVSLAMADAYVQAGRSDDAFREVMQAKQRETNKAEAEKANWYLSRLIQTRSGGVSDFPAAPPAPLPLPQWKIDYERLCREGVSGSYSSRSGQLYCTTERGPVPYEVIKMELISEDPRVVLYHEFVGAGESEELKAMSTSLLSRAMVGSGNDSLVSGDRVGKVAWLWDNEQQPVIARVNGRIGRAVDLDVTFPAAEPLQASNYGVGGHYDPHYDHDEHRFRRDTETFELSMNGDRIATFMIYLGDVAAGGATVFPKIDVFVRPVKNSAVMWYNYKRSGAQDARTLHAGCPVLLGEKWVVNKWIHEYNQMFRRPCDLNPDL